MKIKDFETFIQSFPYQYQATNVARKNWVRFFPLNPYIEEIFADEQLITITREELYSINSEYEMFIIKTLMWGYSTGGRGNNISKLLSKPNLSLLIKKLRPYRNAEISIDQLINDINAIPGLAISTMTKFSHFLNTTINYNKAVILDQQIMNTVNLGRFEDLKALKGIKPSNSLQKYCLYIEIINNLSKELHAKPDQVEMFLFFFGRTLIKK
ncbi:hypothetical protein AAT17_12625 [Nonlabens sp. MIC269]|uniref:8-oxoguanine DNA glycosylase OGG fold protein n=1 Tax=Nonlabens sp. MIC269 TaxID=1476901 RepID=UPI000721B07F|nr:hypothetical protein [Nonlabens sp. MIC269]ALM22014.1 hypothetical protein AAT17_12625 [Nonlabens sp. MIC269]